MSDILHLDLDDNKSPYQAITEIDIDGKQAAIEAESALKRAGFEAAKAQQAARVKQYEGSLAGRMGLEAGGIPAAIVNVPAALSTSAWRYAGALDQAFVNLGQATYAGALEEEDYKAYNRLLTKQGTPEDIVRMGSSRTTVLGESKTVGEMFQEMSKLRELSAKVGQVTDIGESVYSSEKDALTQDALNMEGTAQALRNISEGTWEGADSSKLDSALGFGKDLFQLAANAVKAGANNPEGVFTYLMENSAQYASAAAGTAGKVALAGFTSGYASDYYNKGIEAYQLKNGGQLPPEDVRATMLLQAGAMAGAEYLGTVMASGASALPRALAKGVTEGTEESAVASLKQTLKNANTRGGELLNPLGVVGRTGNVAKAAGGEAATEGTQTYLESAIQGEEASPEDIYIGATIGGLTGGALATPSAAFGMSKEKADQLAASAKENIQRREEIAEAVATGNADKFLEPTSPNYDVVKGMEVLQILAEDVKKTPEERAEIVAKAQDIYDELATPLATLQQELKAAGIKVEDPEWEGQMKAEAEAYRTRIATLEENGGSQEEIAKAEKYLAVREERVAAYADPEVQAKIAEVKAIEDKLDSIKGIVTDIGLSTTKAEETDTPAETKKTEPAKLLIRSMSNLGKLSVEEATALAEDTNNGLTEKQRKYLRSYTAARIAYNATQTPESVGSTIIKGDKEYGNLGVTDYRARVATAIQQGKAERALRYSTMLGKWAANHTGKLAVMDQAFAALKDDNDTLYVGATPQGEWKVLKRQMTEEQRKAHSAFRVRKNSAKLIERVRREADILNTAHAEILAMLDMDTTTPSVEAQEGTRIQEPAQDTTVAQAPQEQAPKADFNGLEDAVIAPEKEDVRTEPTIEVEEEVTEDSTTSVVDGLAKPTEEGAEPVVTSTGKVLRALEEGASYLAQFMAQQNIVDGFKKPLASVQDFFSKWTENSELALDYVSESVDELTAEQAFALEKFRTTMQEWLPIVDSILVEIPKKDEDKALFANFVTYTKDAEGNTVISMEENVKAAIAYAAYSFIQNSGGKTYRKSFKEINALLGRDEGAFVSPQEAAMYSLIGERRGVVILEMGRTAMAAISLVANNNTPLDVPSRLEANFGALALRLLIEVGSVDIHNPKLDNDRSGFIKEPFVRFPNVLNKPNSMNESIATASQGSNSIVSRLMGIEEHVKEPTLKPVKTTQRDLSVDHQEIPEELEKHLNEANKVKNYADGAMMNVLTSLEDEYRLPILGWNPRADYAQKNLRTGLQAKNDSIVRKWENTVNFFNNVLKKDEKTPFYLKHVPQSQNRSGIQQNVFNPQADTNDRYLINRAEWETTVQTDSVEQVNALMIVVAAGLGIDIDKKSHAQALEDAQLALGWDDTNSTVNASPYKEAVDALYRQKWLGEALTKEDKEAIRAAVLKGKNGLHTLKALLALVDLVDAFKNDKHSFKTNMVIEVDGVTNGPMLTNLLWGTYGSDAFMQRGGFFVQGAGYTDYNVWRGEPGHNDLYEVTSIALVNELMKSMDDSAFMQKLAGVTQFTGELDDKGVATKAARTLVKTPITQLHFGSGMETVKDSMFNEFMERILLKFDAAIESGKRSEIVKWVVGVNKILEQGLDKNAFKKHAIPEVVPTEFEFNPEDYWLEYTFSDAQITAFRRVFDEVLGLPMEKTLNIQFDELMQTRKTISYAANEAFTLYQRTYDFLVSLQEEKNGGTSITVGQRKAIEKYLEPMAPRLATPFSSVSENSKTSGIAMFGKKARKTSVNPNYRAQTKVVPYTNAEGKKVGSIDVYGQESVMTAPGVRGASMGIHSVDARTSHTATSGTEALNNHDANMTGLGRIVDQAKRMNTALWNTLMTYSPVSSMKDTLNTTFSEFFKLVDAMPENTRNKLFEHMAKEVGSNEGKVNTYFLKSTLARINIAATKADFNKYSFLSRVQHVGQYGYEGGSVEITDEQREEAERKANSIVEKSLKTTAVARFIKTVEEKKYLTQEQANNKAMSLPGPSWDSLANKRMPLQLKFAAIKALYYLWQSEGKENTASFKHLKVYADFLRGKPEEWNNLFEFQREDIARKVLQAGNALKTEQQVTRAKEVSGEQDQEVSVNDPVTGADTATVDPSAPEVKTWYGPVLGKSDPNGHTPALLAGLIQNKLMKKLETLQLLNKLLGDSADTGFYKALLSKLNGVLPEFTLVYMTKDTPANYIDPSVQFGAGESAKFVFYPKSGKHVIYVLGTDYAASQVSVDVIMHELVHAALSRLIETDAEFAAKLLELMTDVRQKLEAKGQMTKNLEPAFANVDEFLTYGLTHKDFQKLLASVEGKPIKRGVIETAFQAFATLCLKALGIDARRNTALKQLFILGAEGMSRAEKQTEKAATQMIIRNHTSLTPQEQDYTTLDIFDALDKGTLTAPFKRQLKGLLAGLVNTLHGPFGTLGQAAMQKQPIAALDVYMNALAQDRLPFVSDIKNSGFMVSEQEQFVAEQIEATVKAALEDNEGHTTIVYTQLVRMFKEAVKKYPTPESMIDWAYATPSEQAQAKALHSFLFNVKLNEDGKSDYLARFAGMVLGVEQVNNMFSYGSKNRDNTFDTTTFLGRMLSWFDSVLGWFEGQVAKTWDNQIARDKLDTLLNTLVEIEAKKRARIKASADKNGIADFVDKGSVYLNETAKKGLLKFSQSKIFTESKNSYVKFAGTAVGIIAQDKIQEFGEDIRRFHDYARSKKHGIVMGLLREISGESDTTASIHKMLRITKHLETLRKQHIDQTSKTVAASFGKRKFSKEENEALSNYVLRSGMYVLLDKYSLVEIEQMLSDPSKLKAEVTKYEQALVALAPKFANFWITSAKALGHHLVTDSVVTKDLLFNAESIAKAGGTPIQDKISASMASQAEPLIDTLATLQALVSAPKVPAVGSKNSMGQHEVVAKIMREQNARTDGNGVMYTLLLHKTLMEESKNTLFKGSSTLMRKAYIPDVLNPHIEMTAVSQEEGKKLEKTGYRKVGVLNKDARDPSTKTKVLYTVQGGLRPWLSGVYSFTGIGTKGTSIVGSNRNPFTVAGQMNRTSLDNLVDAKHRDMRDVFTRPYTGFDPDAVTENYMAPLRDAHMNIVNYRYMMEAHTKDTVMERDNRFNHLLGTLEGNIFDKQESPEQNKRATQALYDFYQANKRMDSRSFVFVGLGSNDPEMENVYRMFPDSTKEAIRSIWGQEGMWVRRDLTDIAFGYRKVSLAQTMFDSAAEKQMFAQMIVGLFEVMFAGNYPKEVAREKALRWLKNKGDIWEEIVAETKDIIVVKTGIVLLNNVISNMLELKAFGVPTLSILKHHRVAIKAAVAYRKDVEELHKLKQIRDIGFAQGKDAEIERDIVILQDAINSNPVHKLMEEGLMPTIVEDVSADEDIYSYKSKFSEKVDKYMGKLPASMRTGLRFMYMTHDSFLYRKLSEATQLSDFVARYTLYQHEISKKRDPLTHENAVRKVSDAFINYDIPSHRGIQWGNDMGLLMFTKYYLRIQKVILRTMRDAPADALAMLALNHYMDALPMLYDSGFLGDSYGSGLFHGGALEFPGTLDELMTVNAVL